MAPAYGTNQPESIETTPYWEYSDFHKLPPADVVVFLAHPDDEVFTSGTLVEMLRAGKRVQMVYFTDGNRGRDLSTDNLTGDALGQKRRLELSNALKNLGLTNPPLIVGVTDGETDKHIPFMTQWVSAVLLKTRPETVITWNGENGITGHSDHKSVGLAVDAAVQQMSQLGQTQQDPILDATLQRLTQGPGVLHMGLSPQAFQEFQASFPPGDESWTDVTSHPAMNVANEIPADVQALKISALMRHLSQFPKSDLVGFQKFYTRFPWEEFEQTPVAGTGSALAAATLPFQAAPAPLPFAGRGEVAPTVASSPFQSFAQPARQSTALSGQWSGLTPVGKYEPYRSHGTTAIFQAFATPQTNPMSRGQIQGGPLYQTAPPGSKWLYHPDVEPVETHLTPDVSSESSAGSKDENGFQKWFKRFVMLCPTITLLGAMSIMAGNGLKWLPRFKNAAFLSKLDDIGWKMVSGAIIFGNINGISAGIVSKQPSMILANALQLIGAPFLAAGNATVKALGRTYNFLGGALYTLGFSNELVNKAEADNRHSRRTYDMTHLKAIFSRTSGMSLGERAAGLAQEIGGMVKFTLDDHVVATQETLSDAARVLKGSQGASGQDQPWWQKLTQPSGTISRWAVLFGYLGALPILVAAAGKPIVNQLVKRGVNVPALIQRAAKTDLISNRLLEGLRAAFGLTANLSVLLLALQRDDWKGKAPILGVPMTVVGSAIVNNNFMGGLSYAGEGLLNVFYSDVAINGLDKNKQAIEASKQQNMNGTT